MRLKSSFPLCTMVYPDRPTRRATYLQPGSNLDENPGSDLNENRRAGALEMRVTPVRRQWSSVEDDTDAYWQRVAFKTQPKQAEPEIQKLKMRIRLRF